MDEYILHNVTVHDGKNEEITCILNILNHTNVIFAWKKPDIKEYTVDDSI